MHDAVLTDYLTTITKNSADEIRDVTQRIGAFDNKVFDIRKYINEILDLRSLPRQSPMQFLGLFAVLESLLTHNPKPSDPYDSITRQVVNKVRLLNNRWRPQLDYSPFNKANAKTIWTTMYSYRSALAHGGVADFSKDLKLLQDPETAKALLVQTVKSILRLALDEPQLIKDLKDC